MDDFAPTLLELLADEKDPQLKKVLGQYRIAEIELQAAAHQLERMGRHKWSLAVAQRARDVAWQAQRYMRIERERVLKLQDFMDDAPTNPRGYLPHTGLSAPRELAEVIGSHEAVYDTDPAPPPSRVRRRERLLNWALNVALFILVAGTLWLLRVYQVEVK